MTRNTTEPPTTAAELDHDVTGQTVLVTGGAGFVGSHLADALVADNEVRILDNFSSGTTENVPADADLFFGDLRTSNLLEQATDGVDLIFHQAALVSVGQSVREPVATTETNATATVQLLEHARREGARVVLASSAAIYGQPESVPVSEDHPKAPASPYGVSKLSLDRYAQVYADIHDLPTVALRYFNVYGPRGGGEYSGVIRAFREQALAGEPITVEGDGEQTRDFVHVSDVVRANLAAATTEATGRAFNVGTGEYVTINELAELIRAAADSDSEIVHEDPRAGDIRRSYADTAAATEQLGFDASIPLSTGLRTIPGLDAPERDPATDTIGHKFVNTRETE
jgi:UDP-glucose 4-epimerase